MNLSHRKVSKQIRFTDQKGQPIANRRIDFDLRRHSFLFGCGAFDFLPLAMDEGALPHEITDRWLKLFNFGTLPVYWGMFEREEGKTDTENIMKVAKYLKERGVTVKGHPLCWHTVCADWLMKYDNATILKKQLERIKREVSGFKGVIDTWDVINEVVIMPIFDKYDNAITRICKEKGRVRLVKEVFDEAYAANPGATLLINDFNTTTNYQILIDGCLNAGAPISAIGIQSHQHQGFWGKEKLEEVLDRFSVFGLPIHFTENTFISGELMPAYIEDLNDWQVESWPTTPEGEARQAEDVETMYRMLFEHPLVEAITAWDLKDGGWLKAPSGILRIDNSPKPAYDVLDRLINKEWHTRGQIVTDENGTAGIEGFKGEYEVSADGLAGSFELKDDTNGVVMLS